MSLHGFKGKLLLATVCAAVCALADGVAPAQPVDEDPPKAVGPRHPDESGVGKAFDFVDGPEHPYQPDMPPEPLGKRGHGRGRMRPPFFDRLPEEERREVVDFVSEYFPEVAREFRRVWRSDPENLERRIGPMMPEVIRLMRSRDRDPEDVFAMRIRIHRNELKIRKLMRRHASAEDDSRREKLRTHMHELIEKNFDLHEDLMVKQIQRLEARLAAMHERLERRAEDRDLIIENELEQRLEFDPRSHRRPRMRGMRGMRGRHREPMPPPEGPPPDHEEFRAP